MTKAASKRPIIVLLLGLAVFAALMAIPIEGLSSDGQKCLALTMMTVVFWAGHAFTAPAYAAMLLLAGYAVLLDPAVVPLSTIFGFFASPSICLVIGGFLISQAVEDSGLGERIALYLMKLFLRDFSGVIMLCYLLAIVLSFMIPQAWARQFLIMAIMGGVVKNAGVDEKYRRNVGIAVFLGSVATSGITLTAGGLMSSALMGSLGMTIGWLEWAIYMAVPSLFLMVLGYLLQMKMFPIPKGIGVPKTLAADRLKQLGPMSSAERKMVVILAVTILLWATDALHGIHAGYISVFAAAAMSLPMVAVLNAKSWKSVDFATVLFVAAAMAIGSVGSASGMSSWIASILMPGTMPSNIFLFGLFAAGISILLHMFMGSSMTTLGVAVPILVSFGAAVGIPPLVCGFICFLSVQPHWLLPFHNTTVLVGLDRGGFSERDALKFGAAMTVPILITVVVAMGWWRLIGAV